VSALVAMRRFLLALALGALTPPAALAAQTAPGPDDVWRCVIRRGDTLISLGRAYLTDPREWRTVARLNRVADPTRLRVGTALRVPLRLMKAFGGAADVVWTRGDVTVVSAAGAARALAAGDRLSTGERIETGPASAVRVRLVDGALLLIGERARVSFDELTVFALPGVTRTRVGVGEGRVEATVNRRRDPSSRYEIRTPVMTTAVRGTEFRVGMSAREQTARAEVLTGRVEAAAGSTSVGLDPGFGLVATSNAPLSAPRAILAAPDLSGLPPRLARLPVRLVWPALPQAVRYRAQVFSTGEPQTQIADLIVDTPEARWTDIEDGTYRLVVRAVDGEGLEGKDATGTFAVDARPEPPFANAPANASRVYGDRTEFRWTKSEGAASYDLQIATDATFTAPLVDVRARAEVSDAHALPPGTYYWRVASRTASGERGPFGDALPFTQRRYPDGRNATAGVDRTTLTLRWSAGEASETSEFQLSADRDFARVLVNRTLAESEVTVPRPEPGVYFLRVRALDSDGVAGPYGPVQQVDVPALPAPRRHWWWWILPPAAAAGVLLVFL
jgi:hypothetical protein